MYWVFLLLGVGVLLVGPISVASWGLSPAYSKKQKFQRAVWLRLSSLPLIVACVGIILETGWKSGSPLLSLLVAVLVLGLPGALLEPILLRWVAPKQNYSPAQLFNDCRLIVITNLLMPFLVIALAGWDAYTAAAQQIVDLYTVGHTDKVERLRFGPDGKQLLSIGADNTVRLWDVEQAKQLRINPTPKKSDPSEIIPSPDLTVMAYPSKLYSSGIVAVVATADNSLCHTHDGAADKIIFGAPATLLVAEKMKIFLWTRESEDEDVGDFAGDVYSRDSLLFDNSGKMFISTKMVRQEGYANADCLLDIFDVKSGKLLDHRKFGTSTLRVWRMTPDNKYLVATVSGKQICLIELATGTTVKSSPIEFPTDVAVSPDGKWAASFDAGKLQIFDLDKFKLAYTQEKDSTCCAFSPDGTRLATGRTDGAISIWDVKSGKLLRTIGHPLLPGMTSHP